LAKGGRSDVLASAPSARRKEFFPALMHHHHKKTGFITNLLD